MYVSTIWMFTVTQADFLAEIAPKLCGIGNQMFRCALAFPLCFALAVHDLDVASPGMSSGASCLGGRWFAAALGRGCIS